jgi:hypothetical protein
MQFFIDTKRSFKERFDMSKFMEYTDNYDPLTSNFLKRLLELPIRGQRKIEGEENRPDLVSYRIFGDSQYWWIVLMYNRKLITDTFTNGEDIVFPSLTELENLLFSLKAKSN